jgi:hypothetical protein
MTPAMETPRRSGVADLGCDEDGARVRPLLPRSLRDKEKGPGEFAEILCEPPANAPWKDDDDWMTPTRC